MKSRRDILQAHYVGILKKFATWTGLGALLLTAFVSAPAMATGTQMGARAATLSTSQVNVGSVTATFVFKPGSASTLIKSIDFEICTSPLETTACTAPTAGSMAAATAGVQSGTGITNQYGSPTYVAATDVCFSNATGNTLTSGNAVTFPVQLIHNPSTLGAFYFRIITHTNTTCTAEQDFGAVAEDTATQEVISANVQESLTFCVYTGANCAAGGGTVSVGTGADNILSASTPSGGVSYMDAATNAATGYSITYFAPTFSSASDTITAAGGSSTAFTAGTALFGINLVSNTTPAIGGAISGPGTHGQSAGAPFNTANQVSFVASTSTALANSNSLPDQTNKYTVSYIAQAGNTTKPGAFTTTFTYVATGSF